MSEGYTPPFTNTSGSFGLYPNGINEPGSPDIGDASEKLTLSYPAKLDGNVSNNALVRPFCGFASASAVGTQFGNLGNITGSGTLSFRKYNPFDASDESGTSVILGFDFGTGNSAYSASNAHAIERLGNLNKVFSQVVMSTNLAVDFNKNELFFELSIDGGYTFSTKYYNQTVIDQNFSLQLLHREDYWMSEMSTSLGNDLTTQYGCGNEALKKITRSTGSRNNEKTFLRTFHHDAVFTRPGFPSQLLSANAQSSSHLPVSPFNLSYVHKLPEGFTTRQAPYSPSFVPFPSVSHASHIGTVVMRFGIEESTPSSARYLNMSNLGIRFDFNAVKPQGRLEIMGGEYFQTKDGVIQMKDGNLKVPTIPQDTP